MSRRRVLHLLSQRPSLTGSGVTLDRLVRQAARRGWRQQVVVGAPQEAAIEVGGLAPEQVQALRFETGALPFPVPGMSDVMPYRSTVFSAMSDAQWNTYRQAWERCLLQVGERFEPDIVHTHHLWLLSSLVRKALPRVRVVTHCHATGLRQMQLCPRRAAEVRAGLRDSDAFVVLTDSMGATLSDTLQVAPEHVHTIGAGYREDLFHARGRRRSGAGAELLYVGKLARAKGVHCLLDAIEQLGPRWPQLRLHIAGSGSGAAADALGERIRAAAPRVQWHGRLPQPEVADLMRRCDALVLPSFYEGLALVLVEAAACGCAVVSTALPAVRSTLAPVLGPRLITVMPPPMATIDAPQGAALPAFTARLADGIEAALGLGTGRAPTTLQTFTWRAVFERLEPLWIGDSSTGSQLSAS